jgi:hypothetical protein
MTGLRIVEYEPKAFGGGAGKDDSADLEDMNYAERLVTSEEVWEFLHKLKVVGKGTKGGVLEIPLTHLNSIEGYKGAGTGGVCHKVNQVFVALQMPFRAEPMGKNAVRIVRVSQEFNVKLYAVPESGRMGKEKTVIDEDGTTETIPAKLQDYEKPTEGVVARMTKWYATKEESQ